MYHQIMKSSRKTSYISATDDTRLPPKTFYNIIYIQMSILERIIKTVVLDKTVLTEKFAFA